MVVHVRLFFVVFITFFSFNVFAQDAIKVLLGDNKPPFVMRIDGKLSGIEVDIVRAVFSDIGYDVKIDAAPYTRVEELWRDNEKIDAAYTSVHNNPNYHYVQDFVYFENVAHSRVNSESKINSVSDLKGRKVATFQSAHLWLGDEFFALFNPKVTAPHLSLYREFSQPESAVAVFLAGRYDVVVCDVSVFYWFKSQLASKIDVTEATQVSAIFGERSYTPLTFRDAGLARQFEASLIKLKGSGEYDAIYAKYRQ